MSIAIICTHKDPAAWAKALKERLSDAKVEIFPQISDPAEVDFAVCWKAPAGTLEQFPNLKAIQSLGASVYHIFGVHTIHPEIQVARIVDLQLSEDLYEFVLAATLQHMKNFNQYEQQKQSHQWQQHPYKTIKTTTVTVLGLGKIGAFVAEKLADLGFKVNGWSNSEKSIPGVKSYFGKEALGELLSQTDVLIDILPLTEKTRGFLNKDILKKLKWGAYLINVGRGPHLVELDLLPLLDTGHLSGAFLDVFVQEPLPTDHPFWDHPMIRITPHVASLTNVNSAVNQIVENYQRLRSGKALLNTVSAAKGY